VARWCEETPPGFTFDVKLPKALSRHAMAAKFLPPDLRARISVNASGSVQLTRESEELIVKRFLREIAPLIQSRKLGAFLLQLSPAFRPKTNQLTELDSLWPWFGQHLMAVELRNRDWVESPQLEDTLAYFQERGVALVLVHAPVGEHFTIMPSFDCASSTRLGYLRLHGRNAKGYVTGRTVAERFDYDYSDQELKEIAQRARRLEKEVERLHILANNNCSDYAPKAAAKLQKLLGLRPAVPEAHQTKLF